MQLKKWLLLSLLIPVGLQGAAAVGCDDQHYLVDGHCCIKCQKGYHKVQDCDASHPTQCLQCPRGTYTEFENYVEECFVCEHCSEDHGVEEKRPCLPNQNRKCRCKDGFFLEPPLVLGQTADMCNRHQECQPGEGVVERGTRRSDTKCAPCAVGTFSDQGSRTQKCQDWTDCKSLGQTQIIPGTIDRDAVCGYDSLPSTMSRSSTETTRISPTPTSNMYATVSGTSVKDTVSGSGHQTMSDGNVGHATTSGKKHVDHGGLSHTIPTLSTVISILLFIIIVVCIAVYTAHHRGYLQCGTKKRACEPRVAYHRNPAYMPVANNEETGAITHEDHNGTGETACKHLRGQWPVPHPALEAPTSLLVPATNQNEGQEQEQHSSASDANPLQINITVTTNSQIINNTKNTTVHDQSKIVHDNSINVQDCGVVPVGSNNTVNVDKSTNDSSTSTVTTVKGNSGGVQIGDKNTM
ncbi:uncharacterized protein [Branchiostoma lanceolatum]|uniref:uncharacterized protein n=1 Tax=Branchiostoma lanceolatum TaxID=7740 RepID=UPI0034571A01